MIRESLIEMERVMTRRNFFANIVKTVGVAAVYDRFGDELFAQSSADPYQIFSAFGQLVIPVDQDPGWATFEPGITQYGLGVYVKQVFSNGNDLAFNGLLSAIAGFNNLPVTIGYGPTFLNMVPSLKGNYLQAVLEGQFESSGAQDILAFGAIFMLLGVKQVFFNNYPKHLPIPNSEFQILPPSPRAGWDIMKYKGPVGPDEEAALRKQYMNIPTVPGVDVRNPYI